MYYASIIFYGGVSMVDDNKAKGGKARAESLTSEQRKAIARKAATARWDADIPLADFEGVFPIGNAEVAAAVLPNGKRLLTQATFLRALGRSRSPKAGTGVLSTVDGLPFFLQADALTPYISDDLRMSTTPIFFRTKSGGKAVGYDAELLPMVCEVYLKYRDDSLAKDGKIPAISEHVIRACDAVMRGLARVGIVALVDEATGYQEVRDRKALQSILDTFLRKELAAWASCFPNDFYKEIFRLRGWEWATISSKRPRMVGKLTKDIVYSRLAPGILKELEERNPRNENWYRKGRHHQWLTADVGHSALAQHLHAVVAFMRVSKTWDKFYEMLNRAFPKRGDTLELPFMADPSS
jgi:P63C domain-containing protein